MSDESSAPADAAVPVAPVVDRLTRAQVFSRDPESLSDTDLAFAIEELRKINARNRKARADDAAVTETAAKMKKANAAAAKKKAKPLPTDILEVKL